MKILYRWIVSMVLLFVSSTCMAALPDRECDSIRQKLSECPDDSAKVAVLLQMFRRYKDIDYQRASFYSRWMYEEFKHSRDIRLLRIVHFSRGEALLNEEKYDSAIVFYTKALKFSDELGKAQCYYRLGKANDRLGKQELALEQLQTANAYFTDVKSYKNIHGTYDLMIAIHARKGAFDEAIKLVSKKLDLDRSRNSAVKEMEDQVSMATLYGQQNKFNAAFEHLSKALEIAERTKSGYAEIYLSIGDMFLQKNYDTIALMYFSKALEQYAVKEPDDVLADTYNNLGRVHLALGHRVEALQYITQALNLARQKGYRHPMADAYHLMGRYYSGTAQKELAMYHLQKCIQTGCNECSRLAFFDVMVEIGDLSVLQGNRSQADAWYSKALQLAENFKALRECSVARQRLGSLQLAQGKVLEAERFFQQSLQAARLSRQPAVLKSIVDVLSTFCADKGDFRQAYRYEKWSKALGDSIAQMDGKANMAALEMNFEFEHLRKANEARQLLSMEEIRRQKQYRNFLFIILTLIAALAVLVYYGYRKKLRDNRLLSHQKLQIEQMSARLHETDVMKLRFFSNISHEIRTPLTLILHPLKALLNSFKGDDEQNRQLKLVYDNTVRLHELTNQILDLQKLDSGKLVLNPTRADVVASLRALAALFEGFCNDQQIRLVFEAQHAVVFCEFDKDKLNKMVSNLLSNAFKYGKDGGRVVLRMTFDASELKVEVSDNGIGIPKESLDAVFSRYLRLDEAGSGYEGTGIGLAYVKELIDLMQGRIELFSEVGEGTRVVLTIPVGLVEVVQKEEMQEEYRPKPMFWDAAMLGLEKDEDASQTVLIVEDNADLCAMIGGIFEETCRVVYAKNGKEGLDMAIRFIPDVVISDVMMPVMDGLELCAALKKQELTCHIPVLLLTAKDSYDHHLSGYRSGADDYMVKPFDAELLKLKVQNMLETREAMKKQFSLENDSEQASSLYNALDKAFLAKCIALIQENLDDPEFSVDALTEKTAMGRRSLFRKMKALTDMSPYEFITNYRLKQAASMLKSGQRVSEVAYAVGFSTAQSFSIAFKKHFGVLPSEFKG